MANEIGKQDAGHQLTMDNRSNLRITGVREVESFDEDTVVLHTTKGLLIVRGQGLQMQTLSLDGGQVVIKGEVDSLSYEDAQKQGGGLFSRLFR
ncbi:MAG: sporulation protein YabP [Oscillospiraceae bacterium]|jgi:sporulation protein YabP|nr:sporulation protein YabP [Oscillospiraceae bacterium]